MAPLPPLDDPACIRIEWRMGINATIEAGSRIYMRYSGDAPSVADLNTLAGAVATAWDDTIGGLVVTTEALHGVTITDMSSDAGAVGEWTGTQAGGDSNTALPASACVVVNHQISRRYRGGRPRTYVRMGSVERLSGTNEWGEEFVTSYLSAWESFISAVIATTGIGITSLAIVNVSFYSGFTEFVTPSGRTKNLPKLRTDGPVVDDIVLSSVAVKVGSQRRRLNV